MPTHTPNDVRQRPTERRPAVRRRPAAVRLGLTLLLAAAFAVSSPVAAAGQEEHAEEEHEHADDHVHGQEGHGHGGLHFTHPMIAESVTPDTKVRLDHRYFDFPGDSRENSGVLEAEYAFHRTVSLEVGLPYSYTAGELGDFGALLKLANFAFEDSGVLLGYGVGVSFPTAGPVPPHTHAPGEGHGEEGHAELQPAARPGAAAARGAAPPTGASAGASGETAASESPAASPPGPRFHGAAQGVTTSLGTQEWEVEPYLNVGFRGGPWELTAWTRFAIPFHHADQHDVGTELRWNLAALFHASSRLQPLLELDGSSGISGHPVGEDVVFASPGLRVKPFPDQPLWVGTAVGVPLATGVAEDPFDVRWKTSLFWHFPM